MIASLRGAGVEVREHHVGVWEHEEHNWNAGPTAALRLAAAETRLLAARPDGDFDVLVVGYPGHLDLPAARRIAGGRPVVFNPLVSLWDTFVGDRGRFAPGSAAARALRAIDRRALRAADVVVADTSAHADFFAGLAGLPRDRFRVCFVGADERLFVHGWSPPEPFTCLFVGKLLPLHGVETVVAAARLAPEIDFRIVGGGQLEELLQGRPPNVDWERWVPYERLPHELRGAGCALGIFGTTAKAQRVIPNKVFQALAVGAPVVTSDTPAARELLEDGRSALLVPPGDPAGLAEAVRRLASDRAAAIQLAAGGHEAFRARAGSEELGRRWRSILEDAQ